jgi:hypothetical protein
MWFEGGEGSGLVVTADVSFALICDLVCGRSR